MINNLTFQHLMKIKHFANSELIKSCQNFYAGQVER